MFYLHMVNYFILPIIDNILASVVVDETEFFNRPMLMQCKLKNTLQKAKLSVKRVRLKKDEEI